MASPCWRETIKFLILAAFFSSLFAHITCTFTTQGRRGGGGGEQQPPPPPTISPSNAAPHHRTRRLLLGTLCGVFAGFSAAVLAALLIRYSVLYLNTTPILKGPVIFCSRINNPKMLNFLVQQQQQQDEEEKEDDDENPMNSSAQLLSSGVNGKYYRVVLENGMCVAIKRMEPCLCLQRKSVKRRIQEDMEVLGNLKHRNLMSLRAYANELGRFSLVYDCMPNGSLEDVLKKVRSKQLHLNWETRHRIAVGIIKGLHFLHFEYYDHTVYHYNLKPSNVLLDEDYSPRLSDFGLIRLLEEGVRGSVYTAPEFVLSNDFSDKSDVFSFGMVLAVLLTGRDPTDSFFSSAEGGSMGKWLKHLQQAGKAIEGIDKDIVGDEGEEEEMLNAVRIAVVCISEAAAVRPSSDELVHLLTQLHSF